MATRAWWASGALAVIALAGLAWALGGEPLRHDDLFLHARTGAWVLEHGSVPHVDPFSYTRRGYPWTSHEWGFGVLLRGIEASHGIAAWLTFKRVLSLCAVLVLAALATFAIPPGDRRGAPWIVPGVVGLGLFDGYAQLILRAALLTTIFLGIELLILLHIRHRRRLGLPQAASLVLLFGVWANVHSDVVFGLAVLALPVAESALARSLRDDTVLGLRLGAEPGPFHWLPLCLAVMAVVLANANGFQTLTYPLRLNAYLYESGAFHELGHFSTTTPGAYPGYFLLLAAVVPLVALAWRRGRLHLGDLAGVIAFAVLAYRSYRFTLDFAVVAAAPLAAALAVLVPRRLPRWAPLAPAAVTLVAALTALRITGAQSGELLAPSIVVGAGDVLASPEVASAPGRLYNHQNFGGYLGWRLREPVFTDGRGLVFQTLPRPGNVGRLASRFGVRKLAIAKREYEIFLLRQRRANWACVYWDDVSAVFLAREPELRDYIADHEYRWVPAFGPPDDALFASQPGRTALLAELRRAIGVNPRNQRAFLILANVYLSAGDRANALQAMQRAAAIRRLPALEGKIEQLRRR